MIDDWLQEFPENLRSVDLPELGGLDEIGPKHLFDPESVLAVRAALGARRPLLVRGEPGTGKSQLARAAARQLKRPLVTEVITSRTESADLHYRFDAVARLGQAQILGIAGGSRGAAGETPLAALDEKYFVLPGPLWWVFNWQGASDQHTAARVKGVRPPEPDPSWKWSPGRGTVLLIDEIDKADADVPNGLLESLGNGEFQVPQLAEPIRSAAKSAPPLVVITTNEERELPAAFLRRCLVLQLELPKGDRLAPFLVERGRAHFAKRCSDALYEEAARQLKIDRERAESENLPKPGQAEYLDLLRAVIAVAKGDEKEQLRILKAIQGFAFRKNPPAGP